MATGISSRTETLTESLRTVVGDKRLSVRSWREGTDFFADLVEGDGRVRVLRSARHEVLETSYEGTVEFGEVLAKEAGALGLMAEAGIPVPTVGRFYRTSRADESSWLLMSYVDHELGAAPPRRQLGELTRRLHDIRPRSEHLQPPSSWSAFVWDRLRMRVNAARAYVELPTLDDLAGPVLRLLTDRESAADRLLHMDLRADNICVRDGSIVALIDVANCVVGDPMLELGRMRSYGLLDDEFLGGYGVEPGGLDTGLLDVYELDTAALLTVVAVEEIDEPELHREQADRTVTLARRIVDASHGQ